MEPSVCVPEGDFYQEDKQTVIASADYFTEGEFYQKHFDARAYNESYYSSPEGNAGEESFLPFMLESLSKTFSSGTYKGQRLIDIGTGPSIYSIISACDHFQEIILSDYTDSCCEEIRKWLRNEEGCFDWQPIIHHVCKMEGRRPSEVEAKLREKVKRVLKCDVHLENPFHPETVEPADCVTTSLCLEAACKDMPTYKMALGRLATLLRPGGVLVMVGVLGESFYCINETRFSCLKLSKESVEANLQDVGFTIQEFNVFEGPEPDTDVSNYETVFHVLALKSVG